MYTTCDLRRSATCRPERPWLRTLPTPLHFSLSLTFFKIGIDLLCPEPSVGLQPLAVEMDAVAVFLPQGIGVGPFQGEAAVPEGFLGGPEFVVSGVFFAVVGGLGHEPRDLPAGTLARGADELLHERAVLWAGKLPVGGV